MQGYWVLKAGENEPSGPAGASSPCRVLYNRRAEGAGRQVGSFILGFLPELITGGEDAGEADGTVVEGNKGGRLEERPVYMLENFVSFVFVVEVAEMLTEPKAHSGTAK